MKITIPTSIAGASVLPSGISGPLAKLFGNKFDKNVLYYPRDLGTDSARKHYIEFKIFKNMPKAAQTSQNIQPATSLDLNNIGDKLGSVLGDVGKYLYQGTTTSPVDQNAATTIALYIPDSVNVAYTSEYNDVNLTSALGSPYFLAQAGASFGNEVNKILKDGLNANSIKNAVGSNPYAMVALGKLIGIAGGNGKDTADLLLRGIGRALNPQVQVLFKQVGLRKFQFEFTLTPYSSEESLYIKEIIKQLKLASAPEIDNSTAIEGTGMFYKIPDQLEVQFMYNGKRNENVPKIARCVIENVKVDYAPMGWITFNDGTPVQTKLTLELKEIEIIDKTRINQGY
jgi:hypothetical protein